MTVRMMDVQTLPGINPVVHLRRELITVLEKKQGDTVVLRVAQEEGGVVFV